MSNTSVAITRNNTTDIENQVSEAFLDADKPGDNTDFCLLLILCRNDFPSNLMMDKSNLYILLVFFKNYAFFPFLGNLLCLKVQLKKDFFKKKGGKKSIKNGTEKNGGSLISSARG